MSPYGKSHPAKRQSAALTDGVDLGSLYELAEALAHQGVR